MIQCYWIWRNLYDKRTHSSSHCYWHKSSCIYYTLLVSRQFLSCNIIEVWL